MTDKKCPMCGGDGIQDAPELLDLDATCGSCGWFYSTRPIKIGHGAIAGNSRRFAKPGPDFIGPHYAVASLKNAELGPLFWEVHRPAPSYIEDGVC